MLDVQVATHLKGLAKKAKLNERHVKAARVYNVRVASLTSKRTELQERVQHMTEEVERLKFDLKHTMSARAQAESREDEVRSSLTAVVGELLEVRGELRVAQNDLDETRDGLQSAQYELQMVRDELVTSRGELRESKEELRTANGDLRDKVALLDVACREASEAVNLSERMNEECRGLRGDLHQQITSVALVGLLFSRRLLTYTQAWTLTSTSQVTRIQRSLSLRIILRNRVLLLKPTLPLHCLFLLLMPKFLYSSPLA